MAAKISAPLAALAMIVAALSPVEAAVLTSNGVVMINRGNGFEVVQGATEVNPGDSVLVNEGSAQLTYPDGTTTSLLPGEVHMVSQAAAGAAPGALPAEVAGGGGGIGGFSTTTLVLGGVVVLGGIGLAVSASKGSDTKPNPASP